MWDMQCAADERDRQDEREELSRQRNEAMEMIQEMPDDVFLEWWGSHRAEMSDAPTGATWYSKIAGEARRFQFAAATRGHEEPCY